ncbi:hypothetical protein [Klebsiella pneumoniae]|uniref:hypothetical protein n=1 Tax=Klebsiella pneumoniae TaxID=573 RepID=UPI003463D53F
MKKTLLVVTLLGVMATASAAPTQEQYDARVRAVKLFKNEAKSIKGLAESDAEKLSDQVLVILTLHLRTAFVS